jgi:hypothetical protein
VSFVIYVCKPRQQAVQVRDGAGQEGRELLLPPFGVLHAALHVEQRDARLLLLVLQPSQRLPVSPQPLHLPHAAGRTGRQQCRGGSCPAAAADVGGKVADVGEKDGSETTDQRTKTLLFICIYVCKHIYNLNLSTRYQCGADR